MILEKRKKWVQQSRAERDAQKPFVLGLTGSLGMGKSTATKMLRRLKIPVSESDTIVHMLYETSTEVQREIVERFPECLRDGSIDRALLGILAFNDEKVLRLLEGILHPRVRAEHLKFIEEASRRGEKLVVLDVPLLYEAHYEMLCDAVLVVYCDPAARQERVLRRPGMTQEKLEKIIKQQMPDEMKLQKADFVLDTSGSRVHTFKELVKIIDRICGKKHTAPRHPVA